MPLSRQPPTTLIRAAIVLLVWFAASGSVAAEGSTGPSGTRSLEKIVLQLKWFHQFQFAGYYAAETQGYYAEEGLAVEIREIDPKKAVVEQVVAGDADYGVGDPGIISAYANGEPIVALAAIFQHNPLVFITMQSSGIISPYEMAGKRIMFNDSGQDDSPLRALLVEAGLAPDHYRYVPHTFKNESLSNGEVDVMSAYLTNEPFFFKQQGVALNVINPQNYGVDFYGDLLFTSERELSEQPGRAERFRRASLKGWQYALDHPEELVQLIRNRYSSRHSLEHLRFEAREMRKLILPDIIPLGHIEVARLQRAAETYVRLKISKPVSNRQLENFIFGGSDRLDLSPQERAWLVRHPVIRLGIDRDFAPYEWIDEHGNYVGLIADYMKLLEQRLGVHFEVVRDKSWAETLGLAERGEVDLIGAAAKTPEREAYLAFSSSYVSNPAVIINDDRYGYIGNLERLAGKRVAVEHGYFVEELIARDHPDIRLVVARDIEEALDLVFQGKAEAYVGDAFSASYVIKKRGLVNLRFSGQTGYENESRIAVSKRQPELLPIIEKALADIPQAERNALLNRWMGMRFEPGISFDTLLEYGAIVFGLFLLFAWWLFRLLREVRARQSSEARLTSLYTSMAIGFALHEEIRDDVGEIVDYRFLEVNPAFERLTGIRRADCVGHTVNEVLPDFDLYRIEEIGKVVATGASNSFEKHFARIGRWFFMHSYCPTPGQFALLVRDITAKKRAERRETGRNEVLEQLAHGETLAVILNSIVHSVEQENPDRLCSILLLDEDRKKFRIGAAPGLPESYRDEIGSLDPGSVFCSTCSLTSPADRSLEQIPDPGLVSSCPHRDIARKAGFTGCWFEPIRFASGEIVGTFIIYSRHSRARDVNEAGLIEHAANLAAVAIERSRSYEALQLAHLVYQNSTEAMMVTDAENRIIAINPAFTKMTGFTLDEVLGRDPALLDSGKQGSGFYQQMLDTLRTAGHWQGEVWNRRRDGQEFAAWWTINPIVDDEGVVQRCVALFSDITEKKQTDKLIWTQANYDSLTRLPNRRLFADRLEQEVRKAHRNSQCFALLFLDLDSFKEVNDTLGHHMGDELLVEASGRIRGCVRESDTVARLGGDEFTIILSELGGVADIERVAQSVINALNQPFQLGEDRAYVSASVGITVFPDDASTVEGLLRNADQAMYAAKNEGRGRCTYFTHSMQEAAKTRVQLGRDLRQALVENQFRVYYQPIVELSSGAVRKVEALLRWRHPQRGFISPADFIPIAEDTGAIHEIGDWVFRTAAAQAQQWCAHYGADFQISINKSPAQFYSGNRIQDEWIDYLQEIGLDGRHIVIEITEGLLLNAETRVIDRLLNFRDAGVQVAIDDFGTGYSSLSYLKKFSIDYLKIDRSFTRSLAADSEDLALCEAVVVMAHKLGLKVIAEGVETPEQHDLLCRIGCDYAQGYLFAKPLKATDFERILQRSSADLYRSSSA
ncbi:MAG: EAL domain-containing protein [Gammaproteobacteria bacterium]